VKVVILYRPDSEQASSVEAFARDFQRHHDISNKLELVSLNTRDGAAMASVYDIVGYPAILALGDDGAALNIWQGEQLPMMDDVIGYVYNYHA